MLPGTVLMIAAFFVGSESAEWSLNIIGIMLMITLPFLFTPLHIEEFQELTDKDKPSKF